MAEEAEGEAEDEAEALEAELNRRSNFAATNAMKSVISREIVVADYSSEIVARL